MREKETEREPKRERERDVVRGGKRLGSQGKREVTLPGSFHADLRASFIPGNPAGLSMCVYECVRFVTSFE